MEASMLIKVVLHFDRQRVRARREFRLGARFASQPQSNISTSMSDLYHSYSMLRHQSLLDFRERLLIASSSKLSHHCGRRFL